MPNESRTQKVKFGLRDREREASIRVRRSALALS